MRFERRGKESLSGPELALHEAAVVWATLNLGLEFDVEAMEADGFGIEDIETFRRWKITVRQSEDGIRLTAKIELGDRYIYEMYDDNRGVWMGALDSRGDLTAIMGPIDKVEDREISPNEIVWLG